MRLLALLPLLCLLAACVPPERQVLNEDEQVLLTQITRDRYLVVERIVRGPDGVAEVTTRQGAREVRYRLAPAVEGGRELRLRPVDEDLTIPARHPDYPGTGPEPRGLVH